MKTLIRSALPTRLQRVLARWRRDRAAARLHASWDAAIVGLGAAPKRAGKHALIIFPADLKSIVGSLGDEAMITATVDHFRQSAPDLQISMLCAPGSAEDVVRSRGFTPIVASGLHQFPQEFARLLSRGDHDGFVALGADVIDGHYSPDHSTKMIIAADLAARAGMRSIILGCSFNASAAPELAPRLGRLDSRVALNARDPISLDRIRRFAPVRARLVADSGFMLRPGTVDSATEAWIAGERSAGRRVIGVNLHPRLVRGGAPGAVDRLIAGMAAAIRAADAVGPVSWLLIPHDYRDAQGEGDGLCLRPLLALLADSPPVRCRYFDGEHPAGTLKALAGRLDGVVAGRMHLAIASLGMGVPVMCLTYQGKFEGLFKHFELPGRYLLPPGVFDAEGALTRALAEFMAELDALAAQVARERSRVLALAARNFAEDTVAA